MSLYEFVELSPVAFAAWKAYHGSGPGQIPPSCVPASAKGFAASIRVIANCIKVRHPDASDELFSISDEISESADPPWSGAGGRPKLRMREAPTESHCYEPTPTDFEIDCFLESWYKKNPSVESWLDEDQERDLIRTAISTFAQAPLGKSFSSADSTK